MFEHDSTLCLGHDMPPFYKHGTETKTWESSKPPDSHVLPLLLVAEHGVFSLVLEHKWGMVLHMGTMAHPQHGTAH